MNIKDIQAEIAAIYQEIAQINNEAVQAIVKKLLNLFEQMQERKRVKILNYRYFVMKLVA